MSEYFPPEHGSRDFHCLYCNVYASQHWYVPACHGNRLFIDSKVVETSICSRCSQPTFWLSEEIIYPPAQTFPLANNDLSEDIKEVYNEAAAIAKQSPRAACALLRLAIEMLLKQLGETGNLNDGIEDLVKKGLSATIQQSLDIVRVTGNNAVHPGKIDFGDITDVQTLFELINVTADGLITQPKQIQRIYDNIPEKKREAIEKRDRKIE